MSEESRQVAPYVAAIKNAKDYFLSVAQADVNYQRECIFATQALMKNDWSMTIANKNPQSVRLAMINVASTGLTLNPANAYAYLVPRDGSIVLDISYKGLIKIATDTGAIEWVRADVVYADDQFTYNGPACIPEHKADAFKADRGELIGVYCIAKTKDGDVLCEIMPREEIDKIRNKSDLYAKKKSGPWVEWFVQMCKKAVIKRASKTWPYTETRERIEHAIEIANEAEGGYNLESEDAQAERRQQVHDAALGRNFGSVQAIKEELAKDDPDMAYVREVWDEIEEADQLALWLAPTKGGIFTTAERGAIKTGQAPVRKDAA